MRENPAQGAPTQDAPSLAPLDPNLSRADFVYRTIRADIQAGNLRAGDRLRETELAVRMNVSRTPIREAIRRLVSDGLLEIAPTRGVMVIRLDRQQVRELYALREALEGTAARFAAQTASPEEAREIREVLMLSTRSADPAQIARANRMFHHTIHEAARNRYLAQALAQLSDSLALLPGTTYEVPGRMEAAHREHLAIVDAIAARDPEAAERAARDHIRRAGEIRMRMMFEPAFGRPG